MEGEGTTGLQQTGAFSSSPWGTHVWYALCAPMKEVAADCHVPGETVDLEGNPPLPIY